MSIRRVFESDGDGLLRGRGMWPECSGVRRRSGARLVLLLDSCRASRGDGRVSEVVTICVGVSGQFFMRLNI